YFEGRYIASEGNDYSAPDFEKIATAYDLESVTIIENGSNIIALNYFLNKEYCQIANILIDPDQKLVPKLEFGNPLEDMSPYCDEEFLYSLMIIEKQPRFKTNGWVNLK
ncbi:MAG: hypothetical protein KC414_03775, partial [Romboutsia sp.]|nr:hypothetical protein [Romboutsia sp.]